MNFRVLYASYPIGYNIIVFIGYLFGIPGALVPFRSKT